jgi:hypothetical protein
VLSFHAVKHAGSSQVAPGQRVTYTITLTNTGAADFTATDPAAFEDDLGDVLDDAAYNGDARADAGTVSYASPRLSWSGPLPVGGRVDITYTVTVGDPDAGDRNLRNVVTTTADGNCVPDADDTDCRTSSIVSSPPSPPGPGDSPTPGPGAAPADSGDGLAGTGSTIAWGLGIVALVLLGAGAAMWSIRRRRAG